MSATPQKSASGNRRVALLFLLSTFALWLPQARATDGVRNIYGWNTGDGNVSDPNSWLRLTDIMGSDPISPVPESDDVAQIGSPDASTITVTGNLNVALASYGSSSGGLVNMNGAVVASDGVEASSVTFLKNIATSQITAGDHTTFDAAVVADTGDDPRFGGLAFNVTSFTLANAPKFVAGSSLRTLGALGFNLAGGSGGVSALSFTGGATALVNHGAVAVNLGFAGANLPATTAVFMLQNSTLNLSDTGTSFTANGDLIVGIGFAGADLPSAINISAGANLITNGKSTFGRYLSGDPNPPMNGKATMTIDGSGSNWKATGEIVLGAASTADASGVASGVVTASNGGALDATGQKIVLGQETGSEGTLNVRNANSTALSKDIIVGSLGTGTLLVEDSALLHNTGDASVGEQAGSTGTATIAGMGSKWQIDGNLVIGLAGDTNNKATGHVTVMNGAELVVNGSSVVLGQDARSQGTLTLDGVGSKYTLGTQTTLEIGRHGDGTLEVKNGASVSLTSTVLGAQSDGSGTILVDGQGPNNGNPSMVETTGPLAIGGANTGTLKVTGGGQMISDQGPVIIGRDQNVTGKVTLDGVNSEWTINAPATLTIGDGGTGTLDLTNGAALTTGGDVTLGKQAQSQGKVTINGGVGQLATLWDAGSHQVMIGLGGNGEVDVLAGGKLTADSLFLGGQGVGGNGSGTLVVDGSSNNRSSKVELKDLTIRNSNGSSAGVTITNRGDLEFSTSLHVGVDGSGAAAGTLMVGPGGGVNVVASGGLVIPGSVLVASTVGTSSITVEGTSAQNANFYASSLSIGAHSGGQALVNVNAFGLLEVDDITIGKNGLLTSQGDNFTLGVQANFLGIDGGALVAKMSGNVSVSGLQVGGISPGTVTISDRGILFAKSAFVDGGSTVTAQGGGVFATNLLIRTGGSVSFSDSAVADFQSQVTLSGAGSGLSADTDTNMHINSSLAVGTGTSVSVAGDAAIKIGPTLTIDTPAPSGGIFIGPGGILKDNGAVTTSAVVLLSGAKVGGSGTINGKLINGGTVAPGDPQTLTVNGDYEQQSGGLLQIAVAGKTMPEFDHLNVTGHITLDMGAKLELDFINGFAPKTGDKFDFLQSGDPVITDNFSEIVITGLEPGFQFVIAPDGVGSFGLVALNDGVATTVPEPSSMILLLFSVLLFGVVVRGASFASIRTR